MVATGKSPYLVGNVLRQDFTWFAVGELALVGATNKTRRTTHIKFTISARFTAEYLSQAYRLSGRLLLSCSRECLQSHIGQSLAAKFLAMVPELKL